LLGVWAIVAWRISPNLIVDGFLIAGGLIATIAVVWWIRSTHDFAERNPTQALLEGAQFVEYKRIEAETKRGIQSSDNRRVAESSADRIESGIE
jgi:hypothetical protein